MTTTQAALIILTIIGLICLSWKLWLWALDERTARQDIEAIHAKCEQPHESNVIVLPDPRSDSMAFHPTFRGRS